MAKQKFQFQLPNTPTPEAPKEETQKVSSLVQKLEEKAAPKSLLDEYKIIPLRKIRANKKNRYPIDEIEKLEDSILYFGLQQDPSVIYYFDEDLYIIEAGHKRFTAICNLVSRFQDCEDKESEEYLLYEKNVKKYEHGLHCKVAGTIKENIPYDYDFEEDLSSIDESVIDSEIRLIITNEEARTITPAVRAENIQRLSRLYERKNLKKKRADKININETIAEQLNITPRQVINYKNTEQLSPDLKSLFDQGKLGLKIATSLAKLSEEEQQNIYEMFQNTELSNTEIKSLLDEKRTLQKNIISLEQELYELKEQPNAEDNGKILELEKQIADLTRTQNNTLNYSKAEFIKSLSLSSQIKAMLSEADSIISHIQSLLPEYIKCYNTLSDIETQQLISPNEIKTKFTLSEEKI